MTDLAALARSLTFASDVVVRRGCEVHCRIAPEQLKRMAELAYLELGADLILVAGDDRRAETRAFFAHYLFAQAREHWFLHVSVRVDPFEPELPSLAAIRYPASRFERELHDLFGFNVTGHPDPRPLVKHAFWPDDYFPLRKDARRVEFNDDGQPFPFTEVGGEGVYEIPVGPVHAGVIEPGHFRFSVLGETIIDLKSRLYFTHKGTEKLFEGRHPDEGVELAERVSGDTTVGHALAYCTAIESAALTDPPARAHLLRLVLLELERLYNHVNDFGAIANDTGFAVANAHCLRVRERLLRLNKRLTGSRLLRGVICPGGVTRDLDAVWVAGEVDAAVSDFDEMVAICLSNTLVRDRLEATGVLTHELAAGYGATGYVARASGVDVDARRDHPTGAYRQVDANIVVKTGGDVLARATVRVDEVRESARLIRRACELLTDGPIRVELGPLDPLTPAFGIVEGWRGRIVHWVTAATGGRLQRVKIVDPSFFNWPALSHALTGNIVPDFPLCNKSFNQSYSGNDL